MAEGAGVAAGHFPGDLVAGPRLAHVAVCRVDDDQRDLLVVGEVADLPVAVDPVGAAGQARVLAALARRPWGRGRRPRSPRSDRCRIGRLRGDAWRGGGQRSRAAPQARTPRPPHSPKCSSTAGATSRSVHCSRSPARPGPQPTKSSGPSESPRVQRAVAAAAGVGDAAPVDRLEARRQRDDEVAGVRSARAPTRPGPAGRVGLAAQPAVLDPRLERLEVPLDLPAAAAQVARPRRRAGSEPLARRVRPPPARSPGGTPGSSRRSGGPSAPSSQQTRSTPRSGERSPHRARDRRARPRPAAGRRGRRGRSG